MARLSSANAKRRDGSLTSAANHSKWEELRLAMHGMASGPQFRCMTLSGHYGAPDGEWHYHFREGGYADLEFVDILPRVEADRSEIISHLKTIGLSGHATSEGFRVYGYVRPGHAVDRF